MQGLVLALVSDAGSEGLREEDVAKQLSSLLPLTPEEAAYVFSEPIVTLLSDGSIERKSGLLTSTISDGQFEPDFSVLVDGAYHRYSLRQRGKTTRRPQQDEVLRKAIDWILHEAVLERGWDLGADFAGGLRNSSNLWTELYEIASEELQNWSAVDLNALVDSCATLLQRPTDREARILAELGRLAFGIEIVLQQSRTTLLHKRVLPETLYLDASVALPLVVAGHPLRPTYLEVVKRWRTASTASGLTPRLILADVFLDEMVAHREEINSNLPVTKNWKNLSTFGSTYRSVVRRTLTSLSALTLRMSVLSPQNQIKYNDWLSENAPYTNITELQAFLKDSGIEWAKSMARPATELYINIRRDLEDGVR